MTIFVRRTASVLLALSVSLAMWSCASSGGGISGTSLVAGPIASFGSIMVNGVEFDTTNAIVTIEGDPAEVADLKLGMFVFVLGSIDESTMTGVAERVASDHLLEGPVEATDVAAGAFTALGRVVITDDETIFDQTTLATLQPGDLVEVFGVLDADASIRATRVEKKGAVEEFETTGVIENLDNDAQTFAFGPLSVDFSEALLENVPPEGLSNGLLVEVETEEEPVGNVLTAVGVEVRDPRVAFEEGDGAQVQGFVTNIVSETEFLLNQTQRVVITENTRFENGDRTDLVLNTEVDVDGAFEAGGVLVAEEIEFVSGL